MYQPVHSSQVMNNNYPAPFYSYQPLDSNANMAYYNQNYSYQPIQAGYPYCQTAPTQCQAVQNAPTQCQAVQNAPTQCQAVQNAPTECQAVQNAPTQCKAVANTSEQDRNILNEIEQTIYGNHPQTSSSNRKKDPKKTANNADRFESQIKDVLILEDQTYGKMEADFELTFDGKVVPEIGGPTKVVTQFSFQLKLTYFLNAQLCVYINGQCEALYADYREEKYIFEQPVTSINFSVDYCSEVSIAGTFFSQPSDFHHDGQFTTTSLIGTELGEKIGRPLGVQFGAIVGEKLQAAIEKKLQEVEIVDEFNGNEDFNLTDFIGKA